MAVNVRLAEERDANGIWSLIHELAIFERSEEEHITTPAQLAADLRQGLYIAFVAEEGGRLIGMALFYHIYSTWKGLSYYLEDIIVNDNHRRKGIGSLLFEKVAEYARDHQAGRLGWQVLEWNAPAIEFYKKYHVVFDEEWITCRMTKEQLQAFGSNK